MKVFKDTVKHYGREVALVVLILFLGFLSVLSQPVEAQQITAGGNVFDGLVSPNGPQQQGVWSDNIGWISMNNCDDSDITNAICGNFSYGVNLDETTGDIYGVAWSDNIGWVSFDPSYTSGCPGGTARLANTTDSVVDVIGSAKVLVGGGSFWDGCISFNSSNHNGQDPYEVTYNFDTKNLVGSAWGDEVLGWISFAAHVAGNPNTPNSPFLIFDAVTSPILVGGESTLQWTTQDVASCVPYNVSPDPLTNNPQGTPPGNDWMSETIILPGGTFDTGPLYSTTIYEIECTGDDGSVVYDDATVIVNPDAILLSATQNPATFDGTNYSSAVYWDSVQTFNQCGLYQVDQNGNILANVGQNNNYQSPNPTPVLVAVPDDPTYFQVICQSPPDSSNILPIYQQQINPSLDIEAGCVVDPGDLSWIAWTMTDIDPIVHNCQITGPIGGQINVPSYIYNQAPVGTYTLSCVNPLNQFQLLTDSDSVTVDAQACPPPGPPQDPDIIFEEF